MGHIGSISAPVLETSPRSFPEKRLVIEPRGHVKDSYFRGVAFLLRSGGRFSKVPVPFRASKSNTVEAPLATTLVSDQDYPTGLFLCV